MTEVEWLARDLANLHGRIRLATRALGDPKLPAVKRDRERARIELYQRYLVDLLAKRDALMAVVSG